MGRGGEYYFQNYFVENGYGSTLTPGCYSSNGVLVYNHNLSATGDCSTVTCRCVVAPPAPPVAPGLDPPPSMPPVQPVVLDGHTITYGGCTAQLTQQECASLATGQAEQVVIFDTEYPEGCLLLADGTYRYNTRVGGGTCADFAASVGGQCVCGRAPPASPSPPRPPPPPAPPPPPSDPPLPLNPCTWTTSVHANATAAAAFCLGKQACSVLPAVGSGVFAPVVFTATGQLADCEAGGLSNLTAAGLDCATVGPQLADQLGMTFGSYAGAVVGPTNSLYHNGCQVQYANSASSFTVITHDADETALPCGAAELIFLFRPENRRCICAEEGTEVPTYACL